MTSVLNETMDSAKEAMESAKAGTAHAYVSTRTMVMDGVHLLAGIVPLLRSAGYDGILARVGLGRRRSPFEGLAIFGAGVVVGAGIGVLVAPMSGERLRRTFFRTLKRDADEAEDMAGKAKDVAVKAERKIEKKLDDGAGKVEDVVKHGADAAADVIKRAAHDARMMVSSATNGASDDVKTQKAQRAEGGAHRSS